MKSRIKKKKQFFFSKIFLFLSPILLLLIFSLYFLNSRTPCGNSISCIKDLSGNYDTTQKEGVFMGKTMPVPPPIAFLNIENKVLGERRVSDKKIYVDLTNQRVYAYEGSNLVYNFLVSTGKWGKTPTGNFAIWIKLRYTTMAGGDRSIGTYYNLPNVPYVMYFYGGFGLHGTYWHNNFGHPMSHGCVNLRTEDAEKLYYWTDPPPVNSTTYPSAEYPGTPVIIYGTAPNE